jgi:hypothetical protein
VGGSVCVRTQILFEQDQSRSPRIEEKMDERVIDLGVKDGQASIEPQRNGYGQSRGGPESNYTRRVIDDKWCLPEHIETEDGIDADGDESLDCGEVSKHDWKIGPFDWTELERGQRCIFGLHLTAHEHHARRRLVAEIQLSRDSQIERGMDCAGIQNKIQVLYGAD